MYFYVEEGGTPIPYMGAHCRHLANTISHLNYLYCGGDAVLCQITLTTSSLCRIPHCACSLDATLHYYKVIRGWQHYLDIYCVIAQLRVN